MSFDGTIPSYFVNPGDCPHSVGDMVSSVKGREACSAGNDFVFKDYAVVSSL